MDVARRPIVKAGTNVPSYSDGLAACVVVSDPRPEGSGARANVSSSSAFISGFFSLLSTFISAPWEPIDHHDSETASHRLSDLVHRGRDRPRWPFPKRRLAVEVLGFLLIVHSRTN